mmetsp:Transcript_732/g.1649  ORF Transcript_732/g.1649 Transcript_732/m.1649 type:complete len:319 (+) Transcript_732:682-1638(+)
MWLLGGEEVCVLVQEIVQLDVAEPPGQRHGPSQRRARHKPGPADPNREEEEVGHERRVPGLWIPPADLDRARRGECCRCDRRADRGLCLCCLPSGQLLDRRHARFDSGAPGAIAGDAHALWVLLRCRVHVKGRHLVGEQPVVRVQDVLDEDGVVQREVANGRGRAKGRVLHLLDDRDRARVRIRVVRVDPDQTHPLGGGHRLGTRAGASGEAIHLRDRLARAGRPVERPSVVRALDEAVLRDPPLREGRQAVRAGVAEADDPAAHAPPPRHHEVLVEQGHPHGPVLGEVRRPPDGVPVVLPAEGLEEPLLAGLGLGLS